MASNNYWAMEWDEETAKARARANDGSGSDESAEELFEDSSEYATSVEEEGSSSEKEIESENDERIHENAQNQEVVLEEIVGEQTIDEGGRVLWRNALDQIVAQEIDAEQQQQDDESENSELLIAVAHDAEQRRGEPTGGRNEYPNTISSRNQENCVVEYMEEVVPTSGKNFDDNTREGKIKKKKSTKKKRKKKSKGDSKEGGTPGGGGTGGGEKPKKIKTPKDVEKQVPEEAPIIETKSEPKMKKECPICDKVLSSKEAFRTHLKLHNDPEIFNCKLCDKCFKFKQSLDRHMSHHTGHFPFYCGICEKGFVKGKRCRDHELVHLKEYLKGIGRSKTTLFDLTSEELQALKEIVKADFKNQQENGTAPPPVSPTTPPKRGSRKISSSEIEDDPKPKYIKTEDNETLIDIKQDEIQVKDDVIVPINDVSDTGNHVKDNEKDFNDQYENYPAKVIDDADTDIIGGFQHEIKVKEEVVEEEEIEEEEEEEEEVGQIYSEVANTHEIESERKMIDSSKEGGSKTYAKFYSVGDRTWKKKRKSKTPLRLKIKLGQQKQ